MRKKILFPAALLLLVFSFVLSLCVGSAQISIREAVSALQNGSLTPDSRILFPAGRYYLDGEALADLITLPLPTDPARQSDRSAELIKALVRRHLPAVLSESGEELVTQLLIHSRSDLTLLDYLERRTALGTLARREEIPIYCVYLDGTAGQAGYYLSEVSITCLRAAFPAE